MVTTGPSFTTRRMEAFEAMSQMTQANPQLWQVIGDLLVKNMDWPGAEDMAKRLMNEAGVVTETISTLGNWCWRSMPRVSRPAAPASARKHAVSAV